MINKIHFESIAHILLMLELYKDIEIKKTDDGFDVIANQSSIPENMEYFTKDMFDAMLDEIGLTLFSKYKSIYRESKLKNLELDMQMLLPGQSLFYKIEEDRKKKELKCIKN